MVCLIILRLFFNVLGSLSASAPCEKYAPYVYSVTYSTGRPKEEDNMRRQTSYTHCYPKASADFVCRNAGSRIW